MKTVAEVVSDYLTTGTKHLAAESMDERRYVLGLMTTAIGSLPIAEVKPIDLLRWLEQQESWKAYTTRSGRVARILACFGWAVRVGLIPENPFKPGKANPYQEFVDNGAANAGFESVSDADFDIFLAYCRSVRLKRIVLFLRWTGCRPVEARRLQWPMIDRTRNVITQTEHKTAKKIGKPRTIHVTPNVADVLDAIKRDDETKTTYDPAGYVFRTRRNLRWGRQDLASEIRRIAGIAGLGRTVGYGIGRVAFIERGILSGANHKALATLVGHTDCKMIDTVYARKLDQYTERLGEIAATINAAPLVKQAS